MTTDDVSGCSCCAPRAESDTVSDSPPEVTEATEAVESEPSRNWVPESCTLPTPQQPVRVAEFDALFSRALWALDRPEPTRLRLRLDPEWEDTTRCLAERESRCCSFFTFTFTGYDGELHLEITVPTGNEPTLDALARQAADTMPEESR